MSTVTRELTDLEKSILNLKEHLNGYVIKINETTNIPKELTFISFRNADFVQKKDANISIEAFKYKWAAEGMLKCKTHKLRPMKVAEYCELFEVTKLYTVDITKELRDAIINTCIETNHTYFDIYSLSCLVSSILGKRVWLISPKPERFETRFWRFESDSLEEWLNASNQFIFVDYDELKPARLDTTSKRAQKYIEKQLERNADKKVFDNFLKPEVEHILSKFGLSLAERKNKSTIDVWDCRTFTNWLNKRIEEDICAPIKALGVDIQINPNGYFSGFAHPLVIKGINKEYMQECADKLEGEHNEQYK